jgi:threonine dehydrogenase-like Zn-dependent dehydrogenase
MVKYVAMLLVVVGMLVTIDSAQARGRRGGCPGGNCYAGGYSGGCPGGVCAVGVVPAKTAAVVAEPKVVAEAAPAVAPVATTQPALRYYTSGRRLFGRR